MHPVAAFIQKEGSKPDTVFVFPSEIAARLWLEASLDILKKGSLPADRFIAWDRFKETAVRSAVAGRQPVSGRLRKLYALSFAKRNAATAKPLVTELIPEAYADSGQLFAPWIAGILPSLALWEQKDPMAEDAETRDLRFLKQDYTAFLESRNLFEPAWQKPPLVDTGKRYILFFPEALEDFREYRTLIASAPFIETVPVEEALSRLPENDAKVRFFPTARQELRTAALEIEQLLANGNPPESIAVHVPDIESVYPYLSRELTLRGIPFDLRAGTKLTSHPAGRLFPLLRDCAVTGFSFPAVKALMLDQLVPWKDRETAEQLVAFGINNHCITPWMEDGKPVDVWEAAFKESASPAESGLGNWYQQLRKHVSAMTGAASFSDIRKHYFPFKTRFLDMELLAPGEDAVIARCLEELANLVALESLYPELVPDSPWSFFISVLEDTIYVPQRTGGGVSLFPYRVAAGTPFLHQFVLDSSQDRATVVYRELPFLRHDRRVALDLADTDASPAFFGMYRLSGTAFTVSVHTFSGYRTPHGYFSALHATDTPEQDPFRKEAAFFADPANLPDRRYPVQKTGFDRWKERRNTGRYSCLREPFSGRMDLLTEKIAESVMDGSDVRTTQKDLNLFTFCNTRWFLTKVLNLKRQERDAEMINERNTGLVVHDALHAVYERILSGDGRFLSANLETYHHWADEAAAHATAQSAEFTGPIAAPLIALLSRRIAENIRFVLDMDARVLDTFIPEYLEKWIEFRRDGICYVGIVDRISRDPADSALVLMDYKTGYVPKTKSYCPDPPDARPDEQVLQDYQMPMYIHLAENTITLGDEPATIGDAWFADIKNRKYQPVVKGEAGTKVPNTRSGVSRDEFEPAMQVFRHTAARFADAVRQQDFTKPENLPRKNCLACDFYRICRTTYLAGDK